PLVLYATTRTGASLDIQDVNPSVSIKYSQLNLTNGSSVAALAMRVKKDQGKCDVLINNAGIYHYIMNPTTEQRREMIDACQAFLPIMSPAGRIVNVSSVSGALHQFNQLLQTRLRNPKITLEEVEALAQEYEMDSMRGMATKKGWARKTYSVSKALETTMTVAVARENPSFYINACCPGWCTTELGSQAGLPPKTAEEGAKIPIRVGFGDIGGLTGQFWANDNIWGKGEGKIQAL
ncbi:MAG: hypothetical protein LQ351_007749, partial [Letrouitia transgressa]